jgi:predicted RNA-binding Zn-ribbon protein involved in translation (DUF1610 family)
MNRLHCINCQVARASLPNDQLVEQHNCPVCGDELVGAVPATITEPGALTPREQPA